MKIILATQNEHKVCEIQAALPEGVLLTSLKTIGWSRPLEETGNTFQENALQKAMAVYIETGISVLADDSGLVVNALKGAPGVFSARYAGEPSDDARNRQKLLDEMRGVTDRKAHFVTVLAFVVEGKAHFFTGEVHGELENQERGQNGFGYDALFVPSNGTGLTFAEMSSDEKNAVSHRTQALNLFLGFLAREHPQKN